MARNVLALLLAAALQACTTTTTQAFTPALYSAQSVRQYLVSKTVILAQLLLVIGLVMSMSVCAYGSKANLVGWLVGWLVASNFAWCTMYCLIRNSCCFWDGGMAGYQEKVECCD